MKYKLINAKTGEEHLCQKIVIDGFDYHVNNEKPHPKEWFVNLKSKALGQHNGAEILLFENDKRVIATNNPNIDIPKVVDKFNILDEWIKSKEKLVYQHWDKPSFLEGYNKSQETHPFSEEDVREIFKIAQTQKNYGDYKPYTFEEAIEIWKEQQPKIVYYEN